MKSDSKQVVLYLITKATWGGAQRYVFDLTTHLPPTFEPVVAYGTPGKLANDLASAGVRLKHIPSLGRDIALLSDIQSFFEILRCIRETRPAVVHLNSSKAAGLGALAAQLCGVKKIVFTAHGWPFKENRNALARTMIYFLSWITSLLADEVIVVSKEDEKLGKKMWLVGNKIRYVPIAIDPPAFLSREDASARLNISPANPRFVTIAELTANKGIRYAIEAIALLKERGIAVEYYIVGDGEERASLEHLARERAVADRVHFLGFVANAARYLQAFDLFLLPSLKEGMPYVLLEAAAAELSVVATTVVDRALASTQAQPGNPSTLADALEKSLRERPTPPPMPPHMEHMDERTYQLYETISSRS